MELEDEEILEVRLCTFVPTCLGEAAEVLVASVVRTGRRRCNLYEISAKIRAILRERML